MDDFKEKIAPYIVKNKKTKLNKSEINEVIFLLKSLPASNIEVLVDTLLELHHNVTIEYFKFVYLTLDNQVKMELITKLLNADKIIKDAKNYGISRLLYIINELLKESGNEENINILLKSCSKRAFSKDSGLKTGEILCKICFNETKSKLLLLDYSKWNEIELKNFAAWVANAITHNTDDSVKSVYNDFLVKYNISKYNKSDVVHISHSVSGFGITEEDTIYASQNEIPRKVEKEKAIALIIALQTEVNKIIKKKSEISKEIEGLRNQLNQANHDKESLTLQLFQVKNKNQQLNNEIRIKDIQLSEAEKKIAEIDERLKNAFNADKSQQSLELISLKNDLNKRLKLDYLDYKKLELKEPTPDYYEALVGVVENVFETLRRKGIIIYEENEE